MVNQGQSFGPSFPPTRYTNPVNNTGGFSTGPLGGCRILLPHTQLSPLIVATPHSTPGSYNMEASQTFPPDVTQATQEGNWGSMAEVGSIQRPARALSPQAGSNHLFPIQRRRMQSLACPVSDCPRSLGRAQDQRRHLLTHLPHWLHCPAPECDWRGDRFDVFVRHWRNGHPSHIRVPNGDECRIYDPHPLMRAISDGTLGIQAAQRETISMVTRRAIEFQKPVLSDGPWTCVESTASCTASVFPMSLIQWQN